MKSLSSSTLMSVNFQELDYSATTMGLLTLRRRKEITLGIDRYEIKLNEEFLMSSLFTVAEVALANLGAGGTRSWDACGDGHSPAAELRNQTGG
jgi:hypothetical protein